MVKRSPARLTIAIVAAAAALLVPAAALASFGIDPGKVYIDNLYPGARGEYTITVYNQGTEETIYSVKPRPPDYTDPEYEPFPYLDWITVTPEEITIPGNSHADVTIAVEMPVDADYYSGKNGEVWISFTIPGDTAMVQIELASRLFISTRPAETIETTALPGDNTVGVIVEADKTLNSPPLTSSEPEKTMETDNDTEDYNWLPLGITLAVLVIIGAGYFLFKRRRRY